METINLDHGRHRTRAAHYATYRRDGDSLWRVTAVVNDGGNTIRFHIFAPEWIDARVRARRALGVWGPGAWIDTEVVDPSAEPEKAPRTTTLAFPIAGTGFPDSPEQRWGLVIGFEYRWLFG